jgi:hypothetical protein
MSASARASANRIPLAVSSSSRFQPAPCAEDEPTARQQIHGRHPLGQIEDVVLQRQAGGRSDTQVDVAWPASSSVDSGSSIRAYVAGISLIDRPPMSLSYSTRWAAGIC